MEKTNSSKFINDKLTIDTDNENNQLYKNCKKRNHSEMMNLNDKLFKNIDNINKIVEVSSKNITKKFEDLAIKKKFKVNKNKTIIRQYKVYPNHSKDRFPKIREDSSINGTCDSNIIYENPLQDSIKILGKENCNYSRESNKFYCFDKNSKRVTIIKDEENVQNEETSDLDTNIDTLIQEDIKTQNNFFYETDDVMMDLDLMNINFDEKMMIDITPEEFYKQEKDMVEKHYRLKNRKIMNLFLNGNKK